VRIAGEGIEGTHVRISLAAIEAVADLDVGGVRLRAGRRRLCVPSVLRLGNTTLMIEAVGGTSVDTRELALRSLDGGSTLWPRVVVVEGPSIGRELVLRSDGLYGVGRDPGRELPIEDPQMSRAHFEIVVREGGIFVRDHGSTGGVWLGSSALVPGRKAVWPAHRMVRAGASVFALLLPSGLATAGPTPASVVPDAPVLSSPGVAPIALIAPSPDAPSPDAPSPDAPSPDAPSPDAPSPVDVRAQDPLALRVMFLAFAVVSVFILLALAGSSFDRDRHDRARVVSASGARGTTGRSAALGVSAARAFRSDETHRGSNPEGDDDASTCGARLDARTHSRHCQGHLT
jgi:hypothetical protein